MLGCCPKEEIIYDVKFEPKYTNIGCFKNKFGQKLSLHLAHVNFRREKSRQNVPNECESWQTPQDSFQLNDVSNCNPREEFGLFEIKIKWVKKK